MSQYLSDQETISLIGDLSSYMGLPGPQIPPAPTGASFGGAQHPFLPLQATLTSGAGPTYFVTVGGSSQRCMLPNALGSSQPCTAITGQSIPTGVGIQPNTFGFPRYDLVVGQASLSYTGPPLPIQPELGAAFSYVPGGDLSAPVSLPANTSPVALVVVPPSGVGGGSPSGATIQMVLPSLTFVAVPAAGATSGFASGAQPIMAAVVTAAPFNTPCVAGAAQQNILPAEDAMVQIGNALEFLGPGGAIYIPDASYGAATKATTTTAPSYAPSNPTNLGQAIIFGDDVSFVALADTTVFEFKAGAATLGNARFVDPGSPAGVTTLSVPLLGPGNTYTINHSGGTSVLPTDTVVWIVDEDLNSMRATITATGSGSYSVVSIGELNEGELQTSAALGTIAAGASISTLVTSGAYAVTINGPVTIDSVVTDKWANGVQVTALSQSDIRSIRCIAVAPTGTGVSLVNTNSIHDSHFGSIYVDSGGGGGACGLELSGEDSGSLNSLRFDAIECLSINAVNGPTGSSVHGPSGAATIAGTAICLHGSKVQGIEFGLIFCSTCANGLYVGGAVQDISISQLHGWGNGPPSGSTGATQNGYAVACVGGSVANKEVANLTIGYLNASPLSISTKSKPLNSANGIYLEYVTRFHVDYALVGNNNFDGVFLDAGCNSIGINHLILLNNGQETTGGPFYGVNAVTGANAPQFVSISKLDASAETAAGVINLGDIGHLSFNDMGSPQSGGLSPAFGYYTSDGSSQSAPGMTIGATGAGNPNAFQIGNPSTGTGASGFSAMGTATGWTVNTVAPHLFQVSDTRASANFHAVALDEKGDLGIAGDLWFALGGRLTAASGVPIGAGTVGALYVNLAPTGTMGNLLYIYDPHLTAWHKIY